VVLNIFTDGGSLGNPGPSGIGFAIYLGEKVIETFSLNIGYSTNNQAEYKALIAALKAVKKHLHKEVEKIVVYSDSKLMVSQINGLYKVKNQLIKELFLEVKKELAAIDKPVVFIHIPREKNNFADSLVKKAFTNS